MRGCLVAKVLLLFMILSGAAPEKFALNKECIFPASGYLKLESRESKVELAKCFNVQENSVSDRDCTAIAKLYLEENSLTMRRALVECLSGERLTPVQPIPFFAGDDLNPDWWGVPEPEIQG